MAATTTKLGIINRGLQYLGQPFLSQLNENSIGGKCMRGAYDSILLACLRENVWKFAIKRASLAADAAVPIFGKARYFPLPGDFIRLAPNEATYSSPTHRDWEIEGNKIVTDDTAPLPIRYVSSSITESDMDTLFAEYLSIELAIACCEQITNSNTKIQNLFVLKKEIMSRAKKTNSIESAPVKQPVGSWISARS